MSNYTIKFLALSVILLLILFSCTKQKLNDGYGELKGIITIGPLCPVETIPPEPACLPTKETYKAWATAVWTLNKKSKIAILDPQLDGTYEISIPAGNYVIDFDQNNINHLGGSNLPAMISITVEDTTKLNIDIDTGIR